MSYQPEDPYFRRAKAEGYLARSVYKLEAINRKYALLRPGMRVIDLGAAPGSWSQYLLQSVGAAGEVLAIDVQLIRLTAPNLRSLQVDVFSAEVEELLSERRWDGLVSDMAPATTGHRPTDQARSAALVERSLVLAESTVRPGGFWIAKLLEGPELMPLRQKAAQVFQTVHIYRPPATRKGSTECFLIGLRRRP